jgi:hypothetical protein
MARQVPRWASAAALVVGLAACTASHPVAPAAGQRWVGGQQPGSAALSVAGRTVELAIQRCVRSGSGGVNVTAADAKAHATLVANLADPMSASTLVYSTRRLDNSFTDYALAETVLPSPITGSVHGGRLSISGRAAEQSYHADGKPAGPAAAQAVTLDATCQSVQAPQAYSPRPAHRKEGRPQPHGSAHR